MLELEVKKRESGDSADDIRTGGFVPAVFYGPKEAATSISIDARTLEHVWLEAGETTMVILKGAGADTAVLFRDVQVHPVNGRIMHVDFYVPEKGKKVRIEVPLEFVGVAPAEKLGLIIVKALHEVEIEVAPAELPHRLDVDLAALAADGDRITASQIKLPPSATLLTHGEEIVASVTTAQEEVVEAPAAPEAAPAEGAAASEAAVPGESAAE